MDQIIIADVNYLINRIQPYNVTPFTKTSEYTKLKFPKIREWFGGMCVCGARDELEFCHIIPTTLSGKGRGKAKRMCDILRHPLNYVLRCNACHRKIDGWKPKEKKE